MHFKTANVNVIATQRLNQKTAQALDSFVNRQKSIGSNLIDPELFKAVGEYYDISSDPVDFLYITARGVSADVPNNNGDAFPREELWRFSPIKNCFVYQTFVHDPLQINHVASNPKTARGFLLDAHYCIDDPADEHVELVIAVDTTKDPGLARKFETGEANSFSMGCTAEMTQCSVCGNVAHSPQDFCDHIKHYRMQHIAGQLVYEKCYGVDYTELSYVTDPADVKALTKNFLGFPGKKASSSVSFGNNLFARLPLTPLQRREVCQFFEYNLDKLPDGIIALGNSLFRE